MFCLTDESSAGWTAICPKVGVAHARDVQRRRSDSRGVKSDQTVRAEIVRGVLM
jgi:hypothetical protein